ncbi:halocyanin domain protein [Halorubrum aidingense JCM 13560]|uniref:Halocyanin domain protein n=1 Tax=Halorubrum aidingense JCM 13560 TaxID=1230454 RepID=M0PGH3_9EURY|nr:halocyanin domain-containing protein [Halorubrum aidingense]EMA68679.1 halocyanin domain protein [Halorubrum aidingense JCM 13560]
MSDRTRRDVLASVGAATAVALAGCASAGLPGGDSDGERVDRTDEETVDVAVGADGGFAFEPAHVTVDVGTTVVWEWTGEGGGHNVYEVNERFESELTDEAGFTFEHTFDEPGTFEYVCTPHQTQGMAGSVEVVE